MSKSEEPSIDRRKMLQASVAAGLSASLLGCQREDDQRLPEGAEATTTPIPNADREEDSHRVYIVEPKEIQYFYSAARKLKPTPQCISWTDGRLRVQEDAQTKPKRELDFLVWANSEEAEKLRTLENIKAIIAYRSDLVVQVGDEKKANGKLAVRLFPNNYDSAAAAKKDETRNFATSEQVAATWRSQFGDARGLSLKVIAAEQGAEKPWGMVPYDGQILIEFSGERLDPKSLQMIKAHPQVVGLSWGDLFQYFYCPGCGLG